MSSFKPALVLPLCASLGLHAAMGWSIARNWSAEASLNAEPIQITYVEPHKQPSKPAIRQVATKAKVRGIPVPRLPVRTVKAEGSSAAEPSDFEKNMESKMKQQQRLLTKLSSATPKSSAEMLADPKKGKIFVEYFTEVRRKIQVTLSERYARRYSVHGGVALGFVLNSQGFLEKVAVLTKGTDGDARLQELAVQCLRESAPFGKFPPELGSDRIAFNVTLYFVDH